MIEVENLSKSFGTNRAVAGVGFSIAKGETFGLLGPNGAGKSTTIAMLVGSIIPDGGRLTVNGCTNMADPVARRNVGVAPQANAVYGELTGRENVDFFGRIQGLSGRELAERVNWSLEFVGLADRAGDRVNHYSGGMKRRLNLACALVHDPTVIVLDEPTVGVDPQSRNFIFDNIEALQKLGRTILYTTHYMEEVERLCHRVAIMDQGKIVALDTVAGLIEKHGGDSVIELDLAGTQAVPELPMNAIREDGRWLLKSQRPNEDLAQLVRLGLDFTELHVRKPDLETVFLNLTGRVLRD